MKTFVHRLKEAVLGILAVALVIGMGELGACATAPTPTVTSALQSATYVATGFAIEKGSLTADQKKHRAQAFQDIAQKLKALNTSTTLTLPTLQADLAPLLAQLPPPDQLAATSLILALKPWIDQQLANPKVANAQATVEIFIDAVITACSFYTGD